jgi:excisionase family DNA binding protein
MIMTASRAALLLTPEDIAERLQVSRRTVRRLIKSQKIQVMRVGRLIRITQAAFEAYLTDAAS